MCIGAVRYMYSGFVVSGREGGWKMTLHFFCKVGVYMFLLTSARLHVSRLRAGVDGIVSQLPVFVWD